MVDWPLKDYEELQGINLQVETQGSEVYDVPDALIDKLRDAEILITQFCPITKKVLDACTKLRFIGVLRGGYENVNVPYAAHKGVTVYHTPGRNATAVADFTVGMILSECRNIARAHANLKEGRWVRDYANAATVPDLEDKTVGIIGMGQIGRKVAKRLHGFDVRLLGYDPYADALPDYVARVPLDACAGGFCDDTRTAYRRNEGDDERARVLADEADGVFHQHCARRTRRRNGALCGAEGKADSGSGTGCF